MEKQQPEKYWNIKGAENVGYKDKTCDQGRAQYIECNGFKYFLIRLIF
jgi:hypothetical protein